MKKSAKAQHLFGAQNGTDRDCTGSMVRVRLRKRGG